jgi:ferritin-like metal-binding protein YciE
MKSTATTIDKKGRAQKGQGNSKKISTDSNESCRNVFVEELKEIYHSEKAQLIAIPIMIKNATTDELVDALKTHLDFTKEHIKRLEDIFCSIGESAIILHYEAMYGAIVPEK